MSSILVRFRMQLAYTGIRYKTLTHSARFWSSSFQTDTLNDFNTDLPLSKEEAMSFLEDILKIQNPLALRKRNPLKLLHQIQRHIKHLIPFTNLAYGRRNGINILPKEEIKHLMFSRQGGVCLTANSFTKAVLQHLGYKAYLIGGNIPRHRLLKAQQGGAPPEKRNAVPESHCGLIVQNVSFEGSMHLVEPGTIHPILQPIPLNFAEVSPVYNIGYYSIVLFNGGPGVVKMYRSSDGKGNKGDTVNFEGRKWELLMTYHILNPRSFDFCENETNKVVLDNDLMPGMFDQIVIFGFSRYLWTVIKGDQFFQYKRNGELATSKIMKTNAEVVDKVKEYFPQFQPERVAEALQFWNPEKEE